MSIGLFLRRYWAVIRGRSPKDEECQELRKLASDYLDLDLSPGVRIRLEKHLQICQPCNGFLDSFRRTLKLLRDMPSGTAPAEIRQSILKQTRQ